MSLAYNDRIKRWRNKLHSIAHSIKGLMPSIGNIAPLIVVQLYLLITYLFYIFGVFKYQQLHPVSVFLFVIACQVALILGYIWAWSRHQSHQKNTKNSLKKAPNSRILSWCLLVGSILTLIQTISIINYSSLVDVIPSILQSISNPGDAYTESLKNNAEINGSLNSYLLIILSPIFYIAFTWSIFWFSSLSKKAKAATVLYIATVILQSLVSGQNIGIFKAFFIIAIVSVTSKLVYNYNTPKVKKNGNKILALLILALTIIGFIYFSITMHSRSSDSTTITSFSNIAVDYNHWLLKISPVMLHKPIIMSSVYTSSGYKGLDYALSQPFESTYGLGNGYFTLGIAKKIGFEGAYSRTYISKISDDWHPTINWHTAYVWFANDVSFYGVPVLLFLIGALFSYTIYRSRHLDPFAISLLPLVAMMLLFLPGNNYVLGNPGTNITFLATLMLLIISRTNKFKTNKFLIAAEKKLFS